MCYQRYVITLHCTFRFNLESIKRCPVSSPSKCSAIVYGSVNINNWELQSSRIDEAEVFLFYPPQWWSTKSNRALNISTVVYSLKEKRKQSGLTATWRARGAEGLWSDTWLVSGKVPQVQCIDTSWGDEELSLSRQVEVLNTSSPSSGTLLQWRGFAGGEGRVSSSVRWGDWKEQGICNKGEATLHSQNIRSSTGSSEKSRVRPGIICRLNQPGWGTTKQFSACSSNCSSNPRSFVLHTLVKLLKDSLSLQRWCLFIPLNIFFWNAAEFHIRAILSS